MCRLRGLPPPASRKDHQRHDDRNLLHRNDSPRPPRSPPRRILHPHLPPHPPHRLLSRNPPRARPIRKTSPRSPTRGDNGGRRQGHERRHVEDGRIADVTPLWGHRGARVADQTTRGGPVRRWDGRLQVSCGEECQDARFRGSR